MTSEEGSSLERLWTKSFILMTIGNLFLFVSFYMLYPTMPLFIQQMGGNESQVGLAMGAFMLSAVAFRPLVGGLLDRYGRRPFIVGGLILFTLAMYMYNWVGGIIMLMGLRILHGMTWAVSTTATITAVTDIIPSARRGEGMGWFGTSMTLAMAVGPMAGIWVAESRSYSSLFLLAVALAAAALLLMAGANLPFQPASPARRIEWFEKSVLPVAGSVFFLFVAYGGITTFVPLFAKSLQVNSGTFFLVFAATLALSRPLSGKLSDRYGERIVIMPALAATIGALIVLSLSTGLTGILVSAVLYGIGFGSAQPAFQAATIRLARPDRLGVANASLTAANDLGIGLGAIALGWISQYASYQALFAVSAGSVAVSLILFMIFVNRLLRKTIEPALQ
ncbi:MFS transporter [Paenibacillus sp. D51F]